MGRFLATLLFVVRLVSGQPAVSECNQKAGIVLGFPDVINVKYQYFFKNNIYLGGISFFAMTRSFGNLPVNLPSFCVGYEPFRGKSFTPGFETIVTFWVWDNVLQSSYGDNPINVHANHLIFTARPYISFGKSWGICLSAGICFIQNWDDSEKYGIDYNGFYNKNPIYPSLGFYLWFAFY
jgi:hypothetical protein